MTAYIARWPVVFGPYELVCSYLHWRQQELFALVLADESITCDQGSI